MSDDNDRIKVSWGPKEWSVVIGAIFLGLNSLLGTWYSYHNGNAIQQTKAVVEEHGQTLDSVKADTKKIGDVQAEVKKELVDQKSKP